MKKLRKALRVPPHDPLALGRQRKVIVDMRRSVEKVRSALRGLAAEGEALLDGRDSVIARRNHVGVNVDDASSTE